MSKLNPNESFGDNFHELIREMIIREIDATQDHFLERKEQEIKNVFAKARREEEERIDSMLEGVHSHTAGQHKELLQLNFRIKELEGTVEDLRFEIRGLHE